MTDSGTTVGANYTGDSIHASEIADETTALLNLSQTSRNPSRLNSSHHFTSSFDAAQKTKSGLALVTDYDHEPTVLVAFVIAIPVFIGYATLLKLQSHLRNHVLHTDGLGPSAHTDAAYIFGTCVSAYYVGTLLFRVGHNVIFGWKMKLAPRDRVLVAYLLMAFTSWMIAFLYYWLLPNVLSLTDTEEATEKHKYALIGVLLCYFLGGVAVSTFEPNALSFLTPLGHRSKNLAIVGIPIGINSVTIVALLLLGFLSDSESTRIAIEAGVYIAVGVINVGGAIVFKFCVPYVPFQASEDDMYAFFRGLKRWKEWLGAVKWPMLANFVDQLSLALSISIAQYIYNVKSIPLFHNLASAESARAGPHLQHDQYLAIYFAFGFVGGVLSRRLTYFIQQRNPLWYLILDVIGIGLILSKAPILAPFGLFLIMYGNGAIYATSVKHVDLVVSHDYNLIALSCYLCVGDIGGIIGANAVVPIRACLGSV